MAYIDKHGVEFLSEDCTVLVRFPYDFQGNYTIPNSVTIIAGDAFSHSFGLTNVIIPHSVTSIGMMAFYECARLTCITIPDSVTSIGKYAFKDCVSLTSIDIPDSVTSIRDYAFSGCNKLRNILISDSVTSIGPWAFSDCESLMSIKIPNSVNYIGCRAFHNCHSLISIDIPNSVTSIGDDVFANCTGLVSIKIPNSITSIRENAFYNCHRLISIEIPNSVTSIESTAFEHCTGLMLINVQPNNGDYYSIDGVLFDKTRASLIVFPKGRRGTYSIPSSAKSIGLGAFRESTEIKNIKIPNSVTNIGYMAFYECHSLASIEIPSNVKNIEEKAFEYCWNLKTIIVPKGQKARFAQMGGLKELTHLLVERDHEELEILLNVAKAYELGIGVSQSLEQSLVTYMQAAEKGSAEAAYHLGELYEQGDVVPIDLAKAIEYYQRAAMSGYLNASQRVETIQAKIDEEKRRITEQQHIETSPQDDEMDSAYYLFFDTETTGLPRRYDASIFDASNWPRLVQLAWIITDEEGKVLKRKSVIIKPYGFTIPIDAVAIHGITTEKAQQEGLQLCDVLVEFRNDLKLVRRVVGHNIEFDRNVIGAELARLCFDHERLMNMPSTCTMKSTVNFCAIPNPSSRYGGYKWPKLEELYNKLFGRRFNDAHDALADITATKECFFELRKRGVIK